ncbi:MAG: GAF domain-containing protein [Anaerolineales bacterium]|nr:GAF domain-containing protein [Anaerolineales bacterium]
MLNLRPENKQGNSFIQRAGQTWFKLIAPHPSIKAVGEYRRAQLLSIITLIESISFFATIFFNPKSVGAFLVLSIITLTAYVLSRTKHYRIGIYIFTYAFTAFGFYRIYQGTPNSIASSIDTTVHIALVFSSVLLSQRGFLTLVLLATIASFAAPYYSNIPTPEIENIFQTSGVVLVIGAVLYGIQIFRANLDKEQLKELTNTNRELEDITTNLEQRIGARTTDLEKANQQIKERAARFQVISDISQEISANVEQQPKELLNRIVRTISDKFNFYHIGIFLFDENREYAVLRAANSQGGQHMLERRHQLKIGGAGVVGYVSQSGSPRISLDTGSDAVFFNNPDLPKTRSEMALPLKYGSKTIGVLDIQSTLPSAFNNEDVNLLSALANQIAIVINTVLPTERAEYSRISKKATGIEQLEKQSGYSYLPDGTISTARTLNSATLDQALASGETVILARPSKENPSTLAVPVKFREQIIGFIHVEASEVNRKWTEDEISIIQSISDRASLAIENARLFEETERRAEHEQLIAQVTSRIGASNNMDSILQTTIQELGRALGASRSFIQLGASPDSENTIE